jgi:hypothetical protein
MNYPGFYRIRDLPRSTRVDDCTAARNRAIARAEAELARDMLRPRHDGDLAIDEPIDLDTIRTLFGEGSALHRLVTR